MTEPTSENTNPEPGPGHEANSKQPSDPRKQVLGHIRCADCGYDLFGHTANSTCPECGMPIYKTLSPRHSAQAKRNIRRAFRVVRTHALLAMLIPCLPFAVIFLFNEMINSAFYPKSSPATPCVFIFILLLLLADPVLTVATTVMMWQGAESRSPDLQVATTPMPVRVLILAIVPLGAIAVWYSSMPIPLAYVIFRLIFVAELVNQSVRCINRLEYPEHAGGIMTSGLTMIVGLVMIAVGMSLWGQDGWSLIIVGACAIGLAAMSTCYFATAAISDFNS